MAPATGGIIGVLENLRHTHETPQAVQEKVRAALRGRLPHPARLTVIPALHVTAFRERSAACEEPPAPAERNRKMLLVVEDDAIIRQSLTFLLVQEGYEVALSANGRQALDYLGAHPAPDLILLDMLMPVLDGWHFLEEVEAAEAVPIVLTTGSNLTRAWAEDHGCAGFVPKPIELDALLAEIRRCLPAGGALPA